MSLIEEALRRVQDPLTHATAPPSSSLTRTQTTSKEQASAPIHSWPTTPESTAAPTQPATTTRVLTALTLSIFALTLVLMVGGLIWIRSSIGRYTAIVTSQPAPIKAEPSAEPVAHPVASEKISDTLHPSSQPHKTEGLLLSGIVEGLGEPYAVIDGMIVGVGEQVKGATLLEITNGTVKLRRLDGSVLTLSVQR